MRVGTAGRPGRFAASGQSIVLALAMTTAWPQTMQASAPGLCSSVPGSWQAGVRITPSGHAYGVAATMTNVNPALCDEAGHTYKSASAAWIALTELGYPTVEPYNIYQIGWLKCQGSWCPWSDVNYVWAYGHGGSAACGPEKAPSAVKIGTAAASPTGYKIDRGRDLDNDIVYRAYINGVVKSERLGVDLDVCWGSAGPARAVLADEVKQQTDQAGGTVASPQSWTSVIYKNGVETWLGMNKTVGQNCTAVGGMAELSTMRCTIGPTSGDRFRTWDTRQ